MTRALRGGAIALALTAGCSPQEDYGRPWARSTLVWGINVGPDTLNPLTVGSVFGNDVCGLLFLRLADFGPPPDFAFQPALAKSWEVAEDGRSITYRLREDILWHDGVPTTAADVKFTYETVSNLAVPYPERGRIQEIEACEVLDEWTVRFRFRGPSWEPVYATRFPIVPRHLLEAVAPENLDSDSIGQQPVGNGRWKFASWRRDVDLVLEAHESPLGRPGFDRIVFRFVPEDVTLRTELLTGAVDVFHRYPPRYYERDRESDRLRFLSISDGTYAYIGWNFLNPVFADRRVREALTLATDRQAIVDAFRAGFGRAVDVPVFAEHPDFNPNVEPVPFDAERAAALLDEAGWTERDADGIRTRDGKRLEFTYTLVANNELSEEIATMTQEAFGDLGVAVGAEFLEFSVLLERVERKDFDAVILVRSTGLIMDPEDVYHSRSIDGRYNNVSFSDPTVDSLIDLAKSIRDRKQRREVWWRYQEVMQEVRAITPLYVAEALYPVRVSKVQDPVMDVRGPLQRVHEWRPALREGP